MHGDLQDPIEFQYYVARNGIHSDYSRPRDPKQLQADINVAHDHLKKLLKEKGQIQKSLAVTQHRLRNAGLKIWALMFALALEGSLIGWLLNILRPVLKQLH